VATFSRLDQIGESVKSMNDGHSRLLGLGPADPLGNGPPSSKSSRSLGDFLALTALWKELGLDRRKQLVIQTTEEGLRSDRTNTILKIQYRRTIRNVGRRQAAKALKAQPIQQLKLDLFIQKIVQSLEYQDPDNGLSRNGRATAFARNHSRGNAINLARQCRKVDDRTNLDKRITQANDFWRPGLSSEQITFDCTAWLRQAAFD